MSTMVQPQTPPNPPARANTPPGGGPRVAPATGRTSARYWALAVTPALASEQST
mgnify:CR=1 FL=1